MKNDLNATLNKLVAYAGDYLMLDALDRVYTLNRLASMLGVPAPKPEETEAGDDISPLLEQLKSLVPDADINAVKDMLLPAPHTVDYYFSDAMSRSASKAFDFLYDLYSRADCISASAATGEDGYLRYTAPNVEPTHSVLLDIGEPLPYTPRVVGNHIASIKADDIISGDIAARLIAYVNAYGGAIAKRIGGGDYLCCDRIALSSAKTVKPLKDGPVKVSLLDYPVPAISLTGIAKNAVTRETARIIKAAADAGINIVASCAADAASPVFYIVFANDVKQDDILGESDALTACGVFRTVDFSPLMPVLEKGTALSTDLFAFKSIYSTVGGVKHGGKAEAALDGAVVKLFKTALGATQSATADQVAELVGKEA